MLVLTSNGITSEILHQHIKNMMGKSARSAALITTASVGYKEKDWNVPRHTGAMTKLGLKVELFDIDEQNPLLLKQYDVIFVMGGNPFYLLYQIARWDAKNCLLNILKAKLLLAQAQVVLCLEIA